MRASTTPSVMELGPSTVGQQRTEFATTVLPFLRAYLQPPSTWSVDGSLAEVLGSG
jgi:hypothetical protein